MKIRIWPILILGFGALVALVALSGWLALLRARNIYSGISAVHDAEHETEQALTVLRANISLSAILVRDFLLDSKSSSLNTQDELTSLRSSTAADLKRLDLLVPKQQSTKLARLKVGIDTYWQSLRPVFDFPSPDHERPTFSFLQKEIFPRRRAVLHLVADIEQLSTEAFKERRSEIEARNERLARYVGRTVAVTLLIALVVALVSVLQIRHLEHMAVSQHQRVERAESELRNLSRQLVQAQEEERRALSRDLHDQVGQVLTALRMSLGNLELLVQAGDPAASQELDLSKRLLTQSLRSTRDLAMGLRPAMLDDLGLGAALEWHVRQHARVTGVPVSLEIEGPLGDLSEAHRTCVYRIVQEALTNAAKYARAKEIRVQIVCADGVITVNVQDDGVGFDLTNYKGDGLGLLGMRERLGQLGGALVIESSPSKGTSVSAQVPLGQALA